MIQDKARRFAIERHGNQKYGDLPYSVHLDEVAHIASAYGEIATVIAFLHDVVEDTETSLSEIAIEFGELVANCVGILTDEPGESRSERKAKTYDKMSQVRGELEIALIVKTADRLANLRACVSQNKSALFSMYKQEHPSFKKAVYRYTLCDPLWQELDTIIDCKN